MQVSLLSVMDVAAGLKLLLAANFDQEYLRSANTGLGKLSGFQHAYSYPSLNSCLLHHSMLVTTMCKLQGVSTR